MPLNNESQMHMYDVNGGEEKKINGIFDGSLFLLCFHSHTL